MFIKRYGNLFDQVVDIDNLRLAFKKAKRKGRKRETGRMIIRRIEQHEDKYLRKLQRMLISGRYHTAHYVHRTIYEPKKREIFILPFFPDRIVHHAIMNVMEPLWNKLFDERSYSCRRGYGQHKASDYCLEMTCKYKYCLKSDISKFYPSIRHDKMKQIIRKKIKDKRMLVLLDEIIDSPGGETNCPIGNLLSQWFGNLYLNELDLFIRHDLKCNAFVRYCDDFILFSNDKNELNVWRTKIQQFLESELSLRFSKANVFPTTRGIDFLGYRHFPDGYRLIRKSTAKRQRKILREIPHLLNKGFIDGEQAMAKIASVYGIAIHANTYHYLNSLDLGGAINTVLKFSDFAVPPSILLGDKIKIEDVLNREIIVLAVDIFDSVVQNGEKCLSIQFNFADDEKEIKYVLKTGGKILIQQAQQYNDKVPFSTIIKKRAVNGSKSHYYTMT